MKSFKEYLTESEVKPTHKWDGDPDLGWWKDKKKGHVVLYHGTHDRNVASMKKDGINRKDPQTGMISMALEPNTAHGYAAMSGVGGEANFRKAGAKVTNTPHEHRSVMVAHVPHEWIEKHLDPNLGGNLHTEKKRLQSEEEYKKHKAAGGSDQEYYALGELRFNKEIPSHFIKGVMKKVHK